MNNIYNITRGQLITVWIFGGFGWFSAFISLDATYSPSPFLGFLVLFIPFVLIFYTIGWRNRRKNDEG